jgi:hypothetical protein
MKIILIKNLTDASLTEVLKEVDGPNSSFGIIIDDNLRVVDGKVRYVVVRHLLRANES